MTAFQESPEFLRGREGELRIKAFLQSRGWYILPAGDYSGPDGDRAPSIQGAADRIILPDLIAARKGLQMIAEVKTKAKPDYHRITGQYVHGVGRRKCRHYYRCQEEFGARVWLFILEECSQTLLFEGIDYLRRWENVSHVWTGDEMDKGGMVFWPRHVFQPLVLNAIPGLFDVSIPLDFELPPKAR